MPNIAQVQLSDTFDYQRKRINDAIDVVNSMGGGITEVASEASLPDPASATSNVYLIRNHTKFKGAALAALINSVYKITPLKNDVMNSNQFIYVEASQLSSLASINKCVYLDSNGVWQLANSSDPNKYAQGIVGPYNSVVLGGILYSTGLNLSVGATYYYDNEGNLTITPTIGKVGAAIDEHTLSLHFLSVDVEKEQADWNQTDTNAEDYIKNKPGLVSKTAAGLTPQLPDETTVKKFLRQDGIWADPNSISKSGDTMSGTLANIQAAQVRNIVILSEEQDTGVDGTIYMVIEEY